MQVAADLVVVAVEVLEEILVVVEIYTALHPVIEHLVVHMAVVQVLMHHLELVAINCITTHAIVQLVHSAVMVLFVLYGQVVLVDFLQRILVLNL